MKIAYIVPSLYNAGPVNVVHDLVEVMIQHGHQCVVYYFDEMTEQSFPCLTKRISFYSSVSFGEFDVVHTHGLRPNLYILLWKPLRTTTYFIATFHNYVFQDYSYRYSKLKTFFGGYLTLLSVLRHDRVITLTGLAMNYYIKWISKKKLCIAYNSRVIDLALSLSMEEKKRILDFKGDSLLIGIHSRIYPLKGIDLLIQALSYLPNYKLFVAGAGESRREYINLARKCKVEDRICFAGRIPLAHRCLPYYDIYALPSRSEGFPLSVLEAAAYGKNIVCSDIPVFKELYTNHEVSMFELPDVMSLVEAIKKAAENPNYGINAKKKYEQVYSPEAFYERHMNIYKNDI